MAKINSAEYLVGIEKRDRRIAELEAERDRLCQCILGNPARVALKALVERLEAVHADERYKSVWVHYMIHGGIYTEPTYTEALEAARKALKLTKGQ